MRVLEPVVDVTDVDETVREEPPALKHSSML